MLVQSAKDWGSLPSNIKQATSQAASDAVDSRLSASTSHSWTEGGLRETQGAQFPRPHWDGTAQHAPGIYCRDPRPQHSLSGTFPAR